MKTKRLSLQSRIDLGPTPATDPMPSEVMDVLPWPKGYGFAGGETWWRRVLSQTDRERLDDLIGLALLDKQICEQLLTKRDPALLDTFGLSEQAQVWLKNIKASTLKELAQAIVGAAKFPYGDASSEAA